MARKNRRGQKTDSQHRGTEVQRHLSASQTRQAGKGAEKLANGEWRMANKKSTNRQSTISNSPLSAISHQLSAVPYSLSPISYLMPILLLAASILLAYSNTFDAVFHLDDEPNIVSNNQIKNLFNLSKIIQGTDRPVAMIVNALNFHFNALNVRGYHYVNVGIHILTSLVLYFIFLNTLGLPVFSGKYAEKKQFLRHGDLSASQPRHAGVPTLPDNRNVDTSLCRNNYVTTQSVVTRTVLVPTLRVGTNIKHNYDNRKYFLSFAGALIFALHPIQTQAITYIIQGRMAGLATLFYLSALLFFILGAKAQNSSIVDSLSSIDSKPSTINQSSVFSLQSSVFSLQPSALFYLLAILSSALGMGTKEITVTAPIMILIYDYFFIANGSLTNFKKRVLVHIGLFATIGVVIYFTVTCTKFGSGAGFGIKALTPFQYLFTQFSVVPYYIFLILFPTNQNVDYDWHISKSFFEPITIGSFIFITLILVMGIRIGFPFPNRKLRTGKLEQGSAQGVTPPCSVGSRDLRVQQDYRLLTFCVLWFFITLLPESSIIPLLDVIFEHRIYLPSAFSILFFVLLFDMAMDKVHFLLSLRTSEPTPRAKRRGSNLKPLKYNINTKYVSWLAIFSIALIFGALTYFRNMVWKDDATFWEDCVKKSPNKGRPYNGLGVFYNKLGQFDKAVPILQKGIEVDPTHSPLYNTLGSAYIELKQPEKAIFPLQKSIELNSTYMAAYTNLSLAYKQLKQFSKTVTVLEKGIKTDPNITLLYNELGDAYNVLGRFDRAILALQKAIKLEPKYALAYYNLGISHFNMGKYKTAIQLFKKAAKLDPLSAPTYNYIGISYMKLNSSDMAIEFFRKASELNLENPDYYSNLGSAYVASGQVKTAIQFYKKAIKVNSDYITAYKNLAISYEKLGDFEAAIEVYKNMLDKIPQYGEGYISVGMLYLNKLHNEQNAVYYLMQGVNYLLPQEQEKIKKIINYVQKRQTEETEHRTQNTE